MAVLLGATNKELGGSGSDLLGKHPHAAPSASSVYVSCRAKAAEKESADSPRRSLQNSSSSSRHRLDSPSHRGNSTATPHHNSLPPRAPPSPMASPRSSRGGCGGGRNSSPASSVARGRSLSPCQSSGTRASCGSQDVRSRSASPPLRSSEQCRLDIHEASIQKHTLMVSQMDALYLISKDEEARTMVAELRDQHRKELRCALQAAEHAKMQQGHRLRLHVENKKKKIKEHNLVEQVKAMMTNDHWVALQQATAKTINGVQGLQNWNQEKRLNSGGITTPDCRLGGRETRFSHLSGAVTATCSLIASIARQRKLKNNFWLEAFDQGGMGRGCRVRALSEGALQFKSTGPRETIDRGEPELLTGLGVQISPDRYETLLRRYPTTCRHDSFLYLGIERIAVFYTAEAGEHDEDDTADTWHTLLQRWIGDESAPSSDPPLSTQDQLWYLVNCKPSAEALSTLQRTANKNSIGDETVLRMLNTHGTANTYMEINRIEWTGDMPQSVALFKVSLHLKTAARREMNCTLTKELALSWEYVTRLWKL